MSIPSPATTPTVTVRLFAGAAAAYGAEAATADGATLGAVIENLLTGAPDEARQVIDRSSFLVNAVACTDRERILADGDSVDVLPPFAGG